MKRKIIYIVLIILFAIAVSLFTNGCDFQLKEKQPAGSANQQKLGQGTEDNENDEVLSGAVSNSAVSNRTDDSTSTGEPSQAGTVPATESTAKESDQSNSSQPTTPKKYVTISVSCATIYDNLDAFDQAKKEILPGNGFIIPTTRVEIAENETVFDVLLKVTKDRRIHMEYVSTPIYKSNYIEGIGNIYEIDAGPLSGWMYKVNNWFPNYGCGKYILKDGDSIEWVYTCDLGRDIGGDWNEQNK